MNSKFHIEVQVRVMPVDSNGHPQYSNALQLQDQSTFEAADFFEVAAALGKFHELLTTIK